MNGSLVDASPELREVRPKESVFQFEWKEFWRYRHLLYFLTKRDLMITYKQTILGPLHLVIRPLLLSVVFQLIFHRLGKIPTDGVHPFLFYFANNTAWAFFAAAFGSVSGVFVQGKGLMSKVYFPRLIPPLSSILTGSVALMIQLTFLGALLVYGMMFWGTVWSGWRILYLWIPLIQLAMLGMGIGFVFACMTLKYRDLNALNSVLTQGLMYLSPVVFPFALVPEAYRSVAAFNPLVSAMELYRFSIFGEGTLSVGILATGWGITVSVFVGGLVLFNVVQRKFIDVV